MDITVDKSIFSIPKITTTYNFGFEKNGIRLHRAWKVDEGKFIRYKDLNRVSKISHVELVSPNYSALKMFDNSTIINSSSNSQSDYDTEQDSGFSDNDNEQNTEEVEKNEEEELLQSTKTAFRGIKNV
ncbi:unnamed protein product [Didymodactylos carnosus]|uniref:Uncharacterized protein n=1 Tax=Didymodactylos carnosus TaxID=1234261 RepID=A0A813TUF7_9BILA|nr:unnamed protein product [Didymodactylos carnosus]CAF3600254.1 unnamed protein product [Didymodactylos carnosus]